MESGKPLPSNTSAPTNAGTLSSQGKQNNLSALNQKLMSASKAHSVQQYDVVKEMQNMATQLNQKEVQDKIESVSRIVEQDKPQVGSPPIGKGKEVHSLTQDERDKQNIKGNRFEILACQRQPEEVEDSSIERNEELEISVEEEDVCGEGQPKSVADYKDGVRGSQSKAIGITQKTQSTRTEKTGKVQKVGQAIMETQYTRHSTRVKDKDRPVMEKAMSRKTTSKGNDSSSSSISIPSCSLEEISRVCGFSLGEEEATRLANISLIQAKEAAFAALVNTKQKIVLSSNENRDLCPDDGREECGDLPFDESSVTNPCLPLDDAEIRAVKEINLNLDKG